MFYPMTLFFRPYGNQRNNRKKERNKGARVSCFFFLLAFLMYLTPSEYLQAQDTAIDSVTTPFQKGRWLSGLNGSLSSSTLKLQSADDLVSTSSFDLQIFTGTFIKDRWLVALNLIVGSSNSVGLIETESERMLIGPSVRYYFLKDPFGSLYMSVLPGYIRIREAGSYKDQESEIRQQADGPGFATRIRLGYSYVISRRIVLDVGVGTGLSWLKVDYEPGLDALQQKESIFANSTFFSFGFNVLLDEFFF